MKTWGYVLPVILIGMVVVQSVDSRDIVGDPELSGRLELRGSYDDNVLLTADDYDFDLRRRDIDETEQDAFLGTLSGDLKLSIPVWDCIRKNFYYEFEFEKLSEQSSEDRQLHRLKIAPEISLTENFTWTPYYQTELDHRRDNAEYLRPDSVLNELGMEWAWRLSESDRLLLLYYYEKRNYESIRDTPFDDYQGHQGKLGWIHDFSSSTSGNLILGLASRRYEDDTLDRFGSTIVGQQRKEQRAEVGYAVTQRLSDKALLRAGYLFRDHQVRGEFYDFSSHRLHGTYIQMLPWNLRLQSFLQYEWRDYEDQQAERIRVDGATGLPYQEFTGDERSDEQTYILLQLIKDFTKAFSGGLEYQYLDNDSEDDSSSYTSNRYAVFVRYEF